MVSYDAYKNRIQKIAAVKNFIVKFRALFIILAIILVGGISALLALKGMVTGNLTLSAEAVVYGDTYEVSGGSAFMSSVKYEFSLAGSSNWTGEKPTKAGKYLARLATEKCFGGKGHGAAVPFEIKPRQTEFVIQSTNVVYGSDPSYEIELVNGDKLASGLSFGYESIDGYDASMCVNMPSLKILNHNREDVTNCYQISAPSAQITLNAKKIFVSEKQLNYTYNGQTVLFESDIGKILQELLAEGDTPTFDVELVQRTRTISPDEAPLRAGTYTVRVTPRRFFKNGTDVTHLYETEPFVVTFVVLPRPVTIRTESAEQIYNAQPLACHERVADGLIAGDYLIEISGEASLVNAGSIENRYTCSIYNRNDEDVSDCYAIFYEYGTLTVKKRPVSVTSQSKSWVYDGKEHSLAGDYSLGGNLAEHTVLLTDSAKVINVGTTPNRLYFEILDADGNPVTDNYSVNGNWGTLEITKCPIKITTGSSGKEYDGTELTNGEAQFVVGLADGERESAYNVFSITDAGEADNKTAYRIYSGDIETTDNYDITYVYGTLKITKRNVTVTTATKEKVYDGAPFSYTQDWKADSLVYAHTLYPESFATVTNVAEGEVENKVSYLVFDRYGNEVTSNYEIDYVYGKIKRTLRPLTVTTADAVKEYDGAAFSYTDGWYAPNLAAGQTLRVDLKKEPAAVTEVLGSAIDNEVYYCVVDGAGNNVTANYQEIEYVWGKLNRTPFALTLTTATGSWTYDGKTHSDTNYTADRFTQIGHRIAVDENYTPASVQYVADGVKKNEVHYTVRDTAGTDVSYNYYIDYIYGEISIICRAVTITTGKAEKVYDDTELTNNKAQAVVGLANGEKEAPDFVFGIINAGEQDNVTTYKIYSGEYETTGNYKITYIPGKLKITPRPITIGTATESWEYDGGAHFNSAVAKRENIVAGHSLEQITPNVTVTEVKDSGTQNYYEFDVLDGTGRRVTNNYKITYEYGTLNVTPRKITVTTLSNSWVYDGKEHSYTDYSITHTEGGGKSALVSGHGLVVTSAKKIVNVEKLKNYCTFAVRDLSNRDVTENYRITYNYGMLTVTQREIKVTTASAEWEFDGEVHSKRSATADNLVEGHVIEPTGGYLTVNWAGTYQNIYDNFRILDGDKDVSTNYVITSVTYGTLTITPRKLTVTTGSSSKAYDGTPLTCPEGEADRLVGIHRLQLDSEKGITSVTNVYEGITENKVYFTITDGWTNHTPNYEITYVWGELEITPYGLTVTTDSASKMYDGTPLDKLDGFKADWLFTGHKLVLDESRASEFATITNVFDALEVEDGKIDGRNGVIPNKLYFKVQSETDARANENYKIKNYELGTLTITPRLVNLWTGSATKEYDGTPLLGSSVEPMVVFVDSSGNSLLEGHTLVADPDSVTEITDVVWRGGKVVSVSNETRYTVRADGKDISPNYHLSPYLYGELKITPRVIEITTDSKEFEYNGTPQSYPIPKEIYHVASEGAENPLVPGHALSAIEFVTVTNVAEGEVENKVTYIVVDENGEFVNGNYEIRYGEYGTLKITPRALTVKTGSSSRMYNGEPFTYTEYESVDRLVDTHILLPDESKGYASVTNVYEGKVENGVYYFVFDEYGEDVSDNYSITYEWGEIYIMPYELTVYTASAERTYNGSPLQQLDRFSADWLFGDHRLALDMDRADGFATITNVFDALKVPGGEIVERDGIIPNQLYFKVQSVSDARAGENYTVAYEELGTLRMKPLPTAARGGSAEKEYDGKPLRGDSVEPVGGGTLLKGHTLVADEVAQIIDVFWLAGGEAGWILNTTTFKVFDGDEDITLNYYFYNIEQRTELGTLKITPRVIGVETDSHTREYDGTTWDYTNLKNLYHVTSEGAESALVLNHALQAVSPPSICNVGSVKNEVTYRVIDPNNPENTVIGGNYEIRYGEYGTLNVTPRKIAVTTGSGTHEYDDEPFHYFEDITADRLLTWYGHTLAADENEAYATIINVGETPNELKCIVLNAEGEDISYNYEITEYHYGTLNVTPRDITVITTDHEWTYDGYAHSALGYYVDRLISGHELRAQKVSSIKDAGEKPNAVEYEVYKGAVNVTENYNIRYTYGTLTVKPREITVTLTPTEGVTYGDTIAEYASGAGNYLGVSGNGLVKGEELEVAVYYTDENGNPVTPKNAGTYFVVLDTENCFIYQDGDTFDTSNYSITQEESSFEIEKRKLGISIFSVDDKEYDGKPFEFPSDNFTIVSGSTAYGEVASVYVKSYNAGDGSGRTTDAPVNAGRYAMVFGLEVQTPDGVSTVSNYDWWGRSEGPILKITPKELTVSLDNVAREYNGKQFDYLGEGETVHVEGLVKGTLKPIVNCEGVTVGTYDVIFDEENWTVEGDLKSNYTIGSVTNSLVEITKREITVKIGAHQLEYRGEVIPDEDVPYGSEHATEEYGFVADDDTKVTPVYTYTQNGSKVAPKERGLYTVAISFAGNPLIDDNYNVTYEEGTLEIIMRFVTVAVDAVEGFEYDGKAFDMNSLSFSHYHTNHPEEAGFLHGDEAHYNVTFTVSDYTEGNVIYAGEYTVTIELTPKDEDDGYVISYVETRFTVQKRHIYAIPQSYEKEYFYNKQSPDLEAELGEPEYYRPTGTQTFVNNDIDKVSLSYRTVNASGITVTAVNAGTYKIYVSSLGGGFIAENYELVYQGSDYGILEIKPQLLIIAAGDQSTLYTGEPLALDSDNYVLLGGTNLAEGDHLTVVGDAMLDGTDYRTTTVYIESYSITDGNADMRENYRVITAYEGNEEELKELGIRASAFRGKLSYQKRTVQIRQIPPEEYKILVYNGGYFYIDYEGNGSNLFTVYETLAESGLGSAVSEEEYGLLSGHFIIVEDAYVSGKVRVYKEWLKLRVIDAAGNDYTFGYDIEFEEDPASYITVSAIFLKVTVTGENDTEDYEITDGALLEGDYLEIVEEDGELVGKVYQLQEGGETVRKKDVTEHYSVRITVMGANEND